MGFSVSGAEQLQKQFKDPRPSIDLKAAEMSQWETPAGAAEGAVQKLCLFSNPRSASVFFSTSHLAVTSESVGWGLNLPPSDEDRDQIAKILRSVFPHFVLHILFHISIKHTLMPRIQDGCLNLQEVD